MIIFKVPVTSLINALFLLLLASCGVRNIQETEPVPANRFFMLVLEIRDISGGQLEFTPIYEDWKEGSLKSFGPGPESHAQGYWRVDHLDAAGHILSTEWIRDPMRGIYEYSEDGTELQSVEFALKEAALALRVPGKIHGRSNGVSLVRIWRHFGDGPADELLFSYSIKP